MESRYYDPEIETASEDEIRKLQEQKLKRIFQHAWDKSGFYKRKFEEANLTPGSDPSRTFPFSLLLRKRI
jgi:phenylacetate-CoA ligase